MTNLPKQIPAPPDHPTGIFRKALCHPSRMHHARGLCSTCHRRSLPKRPGYLAKQREASRNWRLRHPGAQAEADRLYKLHHPDRIKAKAKRDWQKNKLDPEHLRKKYEATRKWQDENREILHARYRERLLDRHYRLRYGKSLSEKRELLKRQPNCAICGAVFVSFSKAYMDHDHKENKTRELLCRSCNSVLGFAKDSVITLQKASAYLERHNGNPGIS